MCTFLFLILSVILVAAFLSLMFVILSTELLTLSCTSSAMWWYNVVLSRRFGYDSPVTHFTLLLILSPTTFPCSSFSKLLHHFRRSFSFCLSLEIDSIFFSNLCFPVSTFRVFFCLYTSGILPVSLVLFFSLLPRAQFLSGLLTQAAQRNYSFQRHVSRDILFSFSLSPSPLLPSSISFHFIYLSFSLPHFSLSLHD